MNKLIDKIITIKNADKGEWVEKYDNNINGFDILVHPFKLILSGKPNSGKSMLIQNLFLRIQISDKPFDTLIIIQPNSSNEYDILDPTIILNDIPNVDNIVNPRLGKTLIIIDDFDLVKLNKTQQQNISQLFRFISSHCNISIFLSYQSFFDIPRKCANYFILFKTNNKLEIRLIASRIGYDKHLFVDMFEKNIINKHDFLIVDSNCDDKFMFRKNLYEVLNM